MSANLRRAVTLSPPAVPIYAVIGRAYRNNGQVEADATVHPVLAIRAVVTTRGDETPEHESDLLVLEPGFSLEPIALCELLRETGGEVATLVQPSADEINGAKLRCRQRAVEALLDDESRHLAFRAECSQAQRQEAILA